MDKSKIAFGVSGSSSCDSLFYAYYDVQCGCGAKDHRIFVAFEQDGHSVSIIFHKEVSWDCHWQTKGWWQGFKKRLSGALTVLLKGRLDFEADFMLIDVEHIDGFIAALEEGKKRLLSYVEKLEDKQPDG